MKISKSRRDFVCAASSAAAMAVLGPRDLFAQDAPFATSYEYAFQTLNKVPYNKWREYDPRTTCGSTRCGCARQA